MAAGVEGSLDYDGLPRATSGSCIDKRYREAERGTHAARENASRIDTALSSLHRVRRAGRARCAATMDRSPLTLDDPKVRISGLKRPRCRRASNVDRASPSSLLHLETRTN